MGFGAVTKAAGLALLSAGALSWAGDKPAAPPEPVPAVRIAVAPLGYMAPSSFYLTYRLSSESLGFLDNDHLLFTFRRGGLLRRIPGEPDDDDDQEIRALVLDLTTGKVVSQADWRMHDRAQYLWPFGHGKFLLRIRDKLYLTDASLELTPYLSVDAPLRSIQLSPDRHWLVLETEDTSSTQQKPVSSETLGTGKPVKVIVLPAGSRSAVVLSHADNPVSVPILGDAVLDTLESGANAAWVVRALPMHGEPHTLLQVKSGCEPRLQPVSETVALVMGCYNDGDNRPVMAISDKGEQLWRQTWQNKYVWPWFDSAENGSRFVYESVEVARAMSTFEALYPEDVLGQWAGVYDTGTGKLVLVRDVSPVLSGGQNVALSADGMRFAVLRQGAVEIYDLPPVEKPAPENLKKPAGKRRN